MSQTNAAGTPGAGISNTNKWGTRQLVTMALLWEEYCRKCHEAGETPYMSTQFGDKYRRWRG